MKLKCRTKCANVALVW
ncbi:unnamed protein product, partial [Vitis vinifera]|uniref:Uncharacterized protein n=1 Tax=Vitis vinifera TaxID=29760 RepID=D7TAC0_VITVI